MDFCGSRACQKKPAGQFLRLCSTSEGGKVTQLAVHLRAVRREDVPAQGGSWKSTPFSRSTSSVRAWTRSSCSCVNTLNSLLKYVMVSPLSALGGGLRARTAGRKVPSPFPALRTGCFHLFFSRRSLHRSLNLRTYVTPLFLFQKAVPPFLVLRIRGLPARRLPPPATLFYLLFPMLVILLDHLRRWR